ncbi:MAG: O-antigen ligase family protein [Chloroflexi bacterium]|nr:O-antigen ligase family protein [Chloroflexota bacterium]
MRLLTFSVSLLLLIVIAFHSIGLAVAQIRYFTLGIYIVAGFLWIILLGRSKRELRIPRLILPLAVIAIYQFLLIVVSPVAFYGFEIALMGIFYLLIFVFFIDSLHGAWDIETWENALISSAILFALIDVIGIVLWFRNWAAISGSVWPLPPFGYRSEGSFLSHPNLMAAYINLVLPLVITRLILAKGVVKKATWVLLMLFFAAIEYFASSRGAWLGAIAGISVMIVLLNLKTFAQRIPFQKRLRSLTTASNMMKLLSILVVGAVIGFIFLQQVLLTRGSTAGSSGRFAIWANAFSVFRASPIWGNGPSSMRVLYAVQAGLPPGFSAGHAHNAILQIAGELGVIGLAIVGWLALLVVRTFNQAWKTVPESSRPRLAGYAGIFVALAVQHMFDYAFELLPYTVAVLLLLAFLIHLAPNTEKIVFRKRLAVPLFAGLLVLYGLGSAFTLSGSTEFQQGIDAARNDNWALAQSQICAAYDVNAYISTYAFQCALAQAQYTYEEKTNDEESLASAIMTYKDGLAADPYWPVYWANLAALEWATGDRDNAMAHMQLALASAPNNATFALNLGRMEEHLGYDQDAQAHYLQALTLGPQLEASQYFHQTELRRQTLSGYVPIVDRTSSDSLAWAGWRALNEKSWEKASENLNAALEINFNNAHAYAWLARLNRSLGAQEQAQENIQTALFLDNDSPNVRIEASRIAREMGDEQLMMDHLLRAYAQIRNGNQSFEFASVFYMRPLLDFDLVPQLVSTLLSPAEIDDFNELTQLLGRAGETQQAEALGDWISYLVQQSIR